MKDYVISMSYTNFDDDWEVEQLHHKSNWFLTKDNSKILDSSEMDRNFYSLCGLMEESGSHKPYEYSVIQFYAKLDYINKKIERENEANNGQSERDFIPS